MKSKFFIVISLVLVFCITVPLEVQAQSSLAKIARSIVKNLKNSNSKSVKRGTYRYRPRTQDNKQKPIYDPETAIVGNFYSIPYNGSSYIVFMGENTSNVPLYIKVYAVNVQGVYSPVSSGMLSAGESFTFGPSEGWIWLYNYGNKMIVEYSNGDWIYWSL